MTTLVIAHQLQQRSFALQDRLDSMRVEPDRYEYEMSETLIELRDIEEQFEALDLDGCARDDRWQEETEARS